MTDFTALVANPKDFMVEGGKFRSSNKVYRVKFGLHDLVVKNPGILSEIRDMYYFEQDKIFYGNRRRAPAKLRLDQEVKTLDELGKIEGVNVPTVAQYARESKILVLNYIPGRDFRNLTRDEKEITLEKAMDQLELIHSNGKFIGNAHTKKIRLGEDGKVYWVGFCGIYEQERDIVRSQAIDLLKFAYSTYMASDGDKDLTIRAAATASQHYDSRVRERLSEITYLVPKSWKLKWTTRMPLGGKISEGIKNILYDQETVIPGPFAKLA
jgi:tRNA A-37 threonylcarbamoyl transferase component Bud32